MPARVTAYVDGACKRNPGAGGWGCFLTSRKGKVLELCGGEKHTTNNRMELTAAIVALQKIKAGRPVTIYSDSQYVVLGVVEEGRVYKRKRNKYTCINGDLWKKLDKLCEKHRDIEWVWVRGHCGLEGNEKADQLANKGAMPYL